MTTALSIIKDWFKAGKKPTATQFSNTFDSFWHKSETIPRKVVVNSPLQDMGVFSFTLSQTKNNPPEMTVFQDDFTYDPMWVLIYLGKGSYIISSDNEETYWAQSAFCLASQPKDDNTTVRIKQEKDSSFHIMTYKEGDLADGLLDDSVLFEIRMRPGTYGSEDGK